MSRYAQIVLAYEDAYPDPIAGKEGDVFLLGGRHDANYPEFVCATAADERCGWSTGTMMSFCLAASPNIKPFTYAVGSLHDPDNAPILRHAAKDRLAFLEAGTNRALAQTATFVRDFQLITTVKVPIDGARQPNDHDMEEAEALQRRADQCLRDVGAAPLDHAAMRLGSIMLLNGRDSWSPATGTPLQPWLARQPDDMAVLRRSFGDAHEQRVRVAIRDYILDPRDKHIFGLNGSFEGLSGLHH